MDIFKEGPFFYRGYYTIPCFFFLVVTIFFFLWVSQNDTGFEKSPLIKTITPQTITSETLFESPSTTPLYMFDNFVIPEDVIDDGIMFDSVEIVFSWTYGAPVGRDGSIAPSSENTDMKHSDIPVATSTERDLKVTGSDILPLVESQPSSSSRESNEIFSASSDRVLDNSQSLSSEIENFSSTTGHETSSSTRATATQSFVPSDSHTEEFSSSTNGENSSPVSYFQSGVRLDKDKRYETIMNQLSFIFSFFNVARAESDVTNNVQELNKEFSHESLITPTPV